MRIPWFDALQAANSYGLLLKVIAWAEITDLVMIL
jgi:hypothetical protein